jgi:hypothetical protein
MYCTVSLVLMDGVADEESDTLAKKLLKALPAKQAMQWSWLPEGYTWHQDLNR